MRPKAVDLRQWLACIVLTLVLLTLSFSSIAAERKHLNGFGEFSFGMTEMEVRKRITVLSEHVDSISDYDELMLLEAAGEVNIGGISFRRILGIKDDYLVVIQLQNEATNPRAGCDARFNRVYGLIRVKYGDSDTGIKREDFMGLSKISTAHFTFGNSARITLGGLWTGKAMNEGVEKCELFVTYEAPKGSGQF